jgi:hypothetical protein
MSPMDGGADGAQNIALACLQSSVPLKYSLPYLSQPEACCCWKFVGARSVTAGGRYKVVIIRGTSFGSLQNTAVY